MAVFTADGELAECGIFIFADGGCDGLRAAAVAEDASGRDGAAEAEVGSLISW